MVVPGVMEAWRNPTSPAAWGKAAVDIGLIGFSAAKMLHPEDRRLDSTVSVNRESLSKKNN